jgi:histone deacetylase 11
VGGGYHHASRHAAEGFCIYNDIGIAYDGLIRSGDLRADDRILIVDVDAHHGNGNARVFAEAANVVLADVYNRDIYPATPVTRQRVDLPVPLPSGTTGAEYLRALEAMLKQIAGRYRLAFVVAGTDVLATDPLGHLKLTVEDCAARDRLVVARLREVADATVVVAGGGYSADSSRAMIAGIKAVAG